MFANKPYTLDQWLNLWQRADAAAETLLLRQQDLLTAHKSGAANEWIHLASVTELQAQITELLTRDPATQPLFGIPFAVKDNIDVAGMPTTAGCPTFAHIPTNDAFVVAQLRAAGAICLGKTNLDQFATGLNGTRTPYGIPTNPFNPDYITGGSSSGSAVAVAKGAVAFSLGTDTAGSGRVPAGFNNLVGLKPTRGLISTSGVLPACRTLDCVSIFAASISDAERVLAVAGQYDSADPYAREMPAFRPSRTGPVKLAAFKPLDWFGDSTQAQAWAQWREAQASRGILLTEIDPTPFLALAPLLYGGPWVAERLAAIESFVQDHSDAIHPVVRKIILSGQNYSAVDTFKAEYQRAALVRQIHEALAPFDALVVPTSPTFPRIADVLAEPIQRNSELGHYTNFVNLADLSALAVPAGYRADDLPFGVTLIGTTWADTLLAEIGQHLLPNEPAAPESTPRPPSEQEIAIAVVGAHLTGMPLNHQLTSRGARLLKSTTTAPSYRLYALANTTPPKPGLVFDPSGSAIIVEVWAIPRAALADFLEEIPAPLGLGTLTLEDGDTVTGFICEPRALEGAIDATWFGGWRAYIQSLKTAAGAPHV